MRLSIPIVILLLCLSQDNYPRGTYNDHFGESIEFLPNNEFKFYYQFDLAASWSNGQWQVSNDTIYLKCVPILDTLELRDANNKFIKDTLVLSIDPKVDRISTDEYVITSLSAYGQNKISPPAKLLFKNKKLYRIGENGKIETKRRKQFLTGKKKKTYFFLYDK